MTYEVLKDFEDKDFHVQGEVDGKPGSVPLKLETGAKLIPASINYGTDRVEALVKNGTLKLITHEPSPPAEAGHEA